MGSKRRIVVVDDNVDNAKAIHDYLSSQGYDVQIALNVQDGMHCSIDTREKRNELCSLYFVPLVQRTLAT